MCNCRQEFHNRLQRIRKINKERRALAKWQEFFDKEILHKASNNHKAQSVNNLAEGKRSIERIHDNRSGTAYSVFRGHVPPFFKEIKEALKSDKLCYFEFATEEYIDKKGFSRTKVI